MNSLEIFPTVSDALEGHYPRFFETEVPPGTSATQAWQGYMQPFRDDITARQLLRAFEANRRVTVDQGFLSVEHGAARLPQHWAEPLLVSMTTCFKLLVLDYKPPQHPRVYSLLPRICRRLYPWHPHLRDDIPIDYRSGPLPALCIYSAAEFAFKEHELRLVELMDQAATYLAKHLIWTKTRRLYRLPDWAIIHCPVPGELILDCEPRMVHRSSMCFQKTVPKPRLAWSGYWPGQVAPTGPEAHLRTIKPDFPCWCGSGLSHQACHREKERRVARRS
jgi:hypothetical protein